MICEKHPLGELQSPKFVVVFSLKGGRLLLSRHRERLTWETQGGHIEPGETPLEAARRELYEESGAKAFDLAPLFDYAAGEAGRLAAGVVFAAKIEEIGPLPESEMAETRLFDRLPDDLTYPGITPRLYAWAREMGAI
jgi:8-oxo-dGTP diphosphatase